MTIFTLRTRGQLARMASSASRRRAAAWAVAGVLAPGLVVGLPAAVQAQAPWTAAGAPPAGRFVEFTPTPRAFRVAAAGTAAPILVDAADFPGVRRVAADLRADVERVTGTAPVVLSAVPRRATDVVVVGTLGRSAFVRHLVDTGKIDVGPIRGRWEASLVQVVERPWPGVDRALVIVGSDRRGTIFGAYDVSEQAGVSPWYFWADVPVRHRDQVFVKAGRYLRGEPVVRYRGLFINDEAPALSGWANEKFGGFNQRFYARVFELVLRLKANLLWPAMWGSAFGDDDPGSPALADEYGVVIGTSHHEPMMRAHDEWRRYGKGPWNYADNPDALRAFWTEGIKRTAKFESIVTVGMRGDGDAPMSAEANVALLQRIVADQRAILAANRPGGLAAVPQVWALYKEVQDYYEKGMRVPDDVTLLWSDDNWGNIRRLPTAEERSRPGGAGVYYHFDYVGGPRNYKWLNTVPIAKVWEQMNLAWRYGATRLWIVNVGDIKPMEFPIQFFMDYAWDPGRIPAERLGDYTRSWAEREFGPEHAAEIAEIVTRYTTFNGRRKPEMLDPRTYSLVNFREAETVVADYRALAERADALSAALPAAAKDAFYQLVQYPVKACAVVNELYVAAGQNRLFAVQGRASTNDLAERVRTLFREDARLTREYNEALAGGKWRHMMDQVHLGYTYWQQPVRNAMPAVQELQVPAAAEMGVAIEGSEASWPNDPSGPAVLPALSVFDRQTRYVDVFNRGGQPFEFTVGTSAPWLVVDAPRGTVTRDRRIEVSARWADVPVGTERATITIAGPGGVKVPIAVPLLNPATPRPENLAGFVQANGYVSIEAEHWTRASAPEGRQWKVIPAHGRTLSGVTAWPVTPDASLSIGDGMRLEYAMYLFATGRTSVSLQLAPTQKLKPGEGFRVGISFDDETPRVVNMHADQSNAAWERSVGDGATVVSSEHAIAAPGYHTLKVWAIDPAVVIQKIVVWTGPARPSYLGPPESARGK
jgi:hypothetical protein